MKAVTGPEPQSPFCLNARRELFYLKMNLAEADINRRISFAEIMLLAMSRQPEETAKILMQDSE